MYLTPTMATVGRAITSVIVLCATATPGISGAQQTGVPKLPVLVVQIGDTSIRPLAGAELLIPTGGILLRVGASGTAKVIDLAPGRHVVSARRIGYQSETRIVDLGLGDSTTIAFYLKPFATELDPVIVTEQPFVNADLAEFESRRAKGFGHFITRAQIDSLHPSRLRDIVARVPGMAIVQTHGGQSEVRLRRANLNTDCSRQGDCSPAYYIDGIPVPPSVQIGTNGNVRSLGGNVMPPAAALLTATVTVDNFDPSQIAGIEVYSSPAETPPQFLANRAECGVIVMWTVRGSRR
jgi:hypothetical protein